MNAIEKAARDILVALVIEANRGSSNLTDLTELKERYNIRVSDILLRSSIDRWDRNGLLIVSRTYDGASACIKPGKYGAALADLFEVIHASTFDVDWKKEEILTDGAIGDDFPTPTGWKIFSFQSTDKAAATARVDSSKWTGLPNGFALTEQKREMLARALGDAELALDGVGAGNSEKAMARAYIIAAKALADAPEPPADLIWELVQRASNLAGVASLFISVIALFSGAAH